MRSGQPATGWMVANYYQHQAEAVVTGIDMPELDGFEMVSCIRSINPVVRAIYTTGAPEQYVEMTVNPFMVTIK